MGSTKKNQPLEPELKMESPTAPVVLRRRLSHAEQIADRCVHFTGIGMGGGTCKAGVRYADVTRAHDPLAYRREGSSTTYRTSRSFPCLASHNLGGAVCDQRCAPTAEQVAAEEAESERMLTDMLTARSGIVEQTKGKRGVSGSIICPRCLGPLHYSVAASNGHVHARCSTADCLAWME
jgi:hypothetical protein